MPDLLRSTNVTFRRLICAWDGRRALHRRLVEPDHQHGEVDFAIRVAITSMAASGA